MDENKQKIIKLIEGILSKEKYKNYSFNEIICMLQSGFTEWSYVHDPAFISDEYFIKFLEKYKDSL